MKTLGVQVYIYRNYMGTVGKHWFYIGKAMDSMHDLAKIIPIGHNSSSNLNGRFIHRINGLISSGKRRKKILSFHRKYIPV